MLACLAKPFGRTTQAASLQGPVFLTEQSHGWKERGEAALAQGQASVRQLGPSSGRFFSEGALSNFPWSSVPGFHNAGGRK